MSTAADQVEALLLAAPARLGGARLLAVDGPAGSGKSTLARDVAERLAAPMVGMDDLYPGWDGLPFVGPHVLELLSPLSRGHTGSYRRYDWHVGEYLETHDVDPAPVLVLEGVGAGSRAWAHWISVLVWVEAEDAAVRLRRGLDRDGTVVRAQWEQWMADEQAHFEQDDTRSRADLVVRT